jgi:hypothetical protein
LHRLVTLRKRGKLPLCRSSQDTSS